MSEERPPFPPFDEESAKVKVRMAENGWNGKDPEKVAIAYTEDSKWRNRDVFLNGRDEIKRFLKAKWERELSYKLVKGLWAFEGNRIAVRFAYEWHDEAGQWWRSYGNENWEFDERGLMAKRFASINDLRIREADRLLTWDGVVRPEGFAGIEELGL